MLLILLILCGCRTARRLSLDTAASYAKDSQVCGVGTLDFTWTDETRRREIPVRVYIPQCSGRHPVIFFSHGLANSRKGYAYVGEYWAQHGYVVFHVQHHGSDSEVLRTKGPYALYRAGFDQQQWRDRPLDIRFVLDQLEKVELTTDDTPEVAALRGRLDLSRIGVGGHSYGAFTALTLAGMTVEFGQGDFQTFRDPRVKAVVAMSMPKLSGAEEKGAYRSVAVPVMHLTGTRDRSLLFHTSLEDRLVPFRAIHNVPQYLVVLKDAGHSSFSNDERRPSVNRDLHVRAIDEVTLAFWDATLRDDPRAKEWLKRDMPRFITAAGRVETKSQ